MIATLVVVLVAVLGATPTMARPGDAPTQVDDDAPVEVDDDAGVGPAGEDPAVVAAQGGVSEAAKRREAAAEDLAEAETAMQAQNRAVTRARRRREAAAADRADARGRRQEAAGAVEARLEARDAARERLEEASAAVTKAREDLASIAVTGYVAGERVSMAELEHLLEADTSAMGPATVFETVAGHLRAVLARAEDRRDDARDRLDRSEDALAGARADLAAASEALAGADGTLSGARSRLAEADADRRDATVALTEAVETQRARAAAHAAARAELARANAAKAAREARLRREALAELSAAQQAAREATEQRRRLSVSKIDVEDVNIPLIAVSAYRDAAASAPCDIGWWALAGIGRVESNHGRFGGSQLGPTGRATPEIIGVALDGSNGNARITDTDGGRLDRDTTYDRAVGPMQFIPSTWSRWAVDANDDGITDPHALGDAAATAARYLCASTGTDLNGSSALRAAYFSYNRSGYYVERVAAWARAYEVAGANQDL